MKFYNKHFFDIHSIAGSLQGKSVWIAGSDPTLDSYPSTFFDDKCGITLHLAHIKYPNATFRYSSEYDRSKYLQDHYSEYSTLPLLSAFPMYGKTKKETEKLLSNYEKVYFHKMVNYLPTGVRGEVKQDFTSWKVAQTIRNRTSIWGSHGSCLHTCIYAALLCGASEIHVIGSGHGLANTGGLDHFSVVDSIHQNMRTGDTFSDPKISFPVIEQTLALQKACIENGIPFFWHEKYTPEMNSYISISPEALADLKERSKRSFPLIKRAYRFFLKRPYTLIISRL